MSRNVWRVHSTLSLNNCDGRRTLRGTGALLSRNSAASDDALRRNNKQRSQACSDARKVELIYGPLEEANKRTSS